MWSGWMNRFVATTKADGDALDREVRLRDLFAEEEPEELARDELREDDDDEREPGEASPVRF